MGGRDRRVNKTGVIQMDLVFEENVFFRFAYSEDRAEQGHPEGLTFAFFITAVFPVFGELSDRFSLFRRSHLPYPCQRFCYIMRNIIPEMFAVNTFLSKTEKFHEQKDRGAFILRNAVR